MDFRSLLRQQMAASESSQDPSQPDAGNAEGDDEEDTEYVYCPPTEAQLKVLKARRERSDKIAKRMGECLLLGWRMLDTVCPDCGTILLMPAGGGTDGVDPTAATTYCIACRELESDVSKDDPAQSAHAARSQAREAEIAAAAAAAAATVASGAAVTSNTATAASSTSTTAKVTYSVSSNTLSHVAAATSAATTASTASPPEVLRGLRLTTLDRLEFYRQALAVSRDPVETERLLGTLERLLAFLDRLGRGSTAV